MKDKKLVLLAGEWDTTAVVYNFLQTQFGVEHVVIEQPVPKKEFLKKRANKLGWITVAGQVLFSAAVAKPLRKSSARRIEEILAQFNLDTSAIPTEKITSVVSVNDAASIERLQQLKPDLVVVHGTRIISKKVLAALEGCAIINIHAGITPRYRGSHGAYWALLNNDEENCGVTVHLVDAGIDTGNILQQKKISVTATDNFATYPYLQLAEGLLLLKTAIEDVAANNARLQKNSLDSRLWHHPTIWSYLYYRVRRGVK